MTTQLMEDNRLLRGALFVDSVVDGGMGVACILAAGPLAALLGLQAENATIHLRLLGILLVIAGAILLWTSAQRDVSAPVTRAIILLNTLWVGASLVIAFGPLLALTDAGRAIVIGQAAVVAILTVTEAYALRLRQ